jgi:hypothetical protein
VQQAAAREAKALLRERQEAQRLARADRRAAVEQGEAGFAGFRNAVRRWGGAEEKEAQESLPPTLLHCSSLSLPRSRPKQYTKRGRLEANALRPRYNLRISCPLPPVFLEVLDAAGLGHVLKQGGREREGGAEMEIQGMVMTLPRAGGRTERGGWEEVRLVVQGDERAVPRRGMFGNVAAEAADEPSPIPIPDPGALSPGGTSYGSSAPAQEEEDPPPVVTKHPKTNLKYLEDAAVEENWQGSGLPRGVGRDGVKEKKYKPVVSSERVKMHHEKKREEGRGRDRDLVLRP